MRNLSRRPEFAAFIATLSVFIFFAYFGRPTFTTTLVSAAWFNVAAELGLIALPLSLVMIAGHLDLSVGANLAAGAMTYAILTGHYGVSDWIGLPAGLLMGTFIGFLTGYIVVKTRLESFIVSLGMYFGIRGLVFGITRLTTGTVLVAVKVDPLVRKVFGGRVWKTFEMATLFYLGMAIVVSWILYKTKYGNWITAIGGDEIFARAAGVPVRRTTIGLFMGSGFGAALLGVIQVALYGSAQTSAGQSYVFTSIIAVVVGGVLLTGGYGSPIGVIFGTLTYAIVSQGIYSTGWDSDWASLIIGLLLLLAVLMNNTFRRVALATGDKPTKGKVTDQDLEEALTQEVSNV